MALIFLYSCDKDNGIMQPVELRFKNSTGMFIDSVFFNVNEENIRYKITNMDIDETTDYIEFDYSYSPPLTTIQTDNLIIDHPVTDLLCCLTNGKYTVDFEIVVDNNNEETSTVTTKDN